MKISNLILGISLAANAALIGGFMLGAWGSPSSATAPATTSATGRTATGAGDSSVPAGGGRDWAALQTNDFALQRDRLRAEGFPPAMIRALLAAQIRETFADRRKAIEAGRGEIPFWKNTVPDVPTLLAQRALDREIQQTVTALLGPDPENGPAATLQRQFPQLAPDKIAQLATLRDDYDQKRSEIVQGSTLNLSAADGEKLSALEKNLRAEVASVLTPQELEDYDLRTSNTASQLRFSLAAFDVTEQEFRSLFQLQQAFDDRFGGISYGPFAQSPESVKARNDARGELNNQIKAALGDDRYAEYKRATDYTYQQTSRLAARLELPPEAANQVWAVQQDIQQRIETLRNDRTLSLADRTQQLAALNDETVAKVTAALGERGFAAYKQNGGAWMQVFQPPRPAPGAGPAMPAMIGSGTVNVNVRQ
jgi:hypothetical protein